MTFHGREPIVAILLLELFFFQQTSPKDNKVHLIAFYSWSLNQTERSYPIYDKELLAIISALRKMEKFIKRNWCSFYDFFLFGHRNLLYQKKKQKKWYKDLFDGHFFLSEFNIKIVYRAGSSKRQNSFYIFFPIVLFLKRNRKEIILCLEKT